MEGKKAVEDGQYRNIVDLLIGTIIDVLLSIITLKLLEILCLVLTNALHYFE
jgi:hypothetical protein